MRMYRPAAVLLPAALSWLLGAGAAAAETLGEARVGFSAERVLVFDGRRYLGQMWQMPGEQRHEQQLPAMKPVFILRDGEQVGDLLLPQLHTVIEFKLPAALAALHDPGLLNEPVGHERVNGVMTTKYAVDADTAEGHASGSLWLSADGIAIKCDGSFQAPGGKVSTVHWELRHLKLGPQPIELFEVPHGYSMLPPEAATALLGLRLARPASP
jgi:hypothetical protein